MRFLLRPLAATVAATFVFTACADSPTPTSPEGEPELAADRGQDPLPGWFARASTEVMALPGTVFADHDEAGGKLVFGVENRGAGRGVETALAHMGIPARAYEVRVVPAIHQLATLRDRFRPTIGGIQIHFGNYLCTMGFNADDGTQRSFITNSHCTQKQGGVQGTDYYQPLSSVDNTVIADEVEDPTYFRGSPCPAGRRCRYSDASRALYRAGTTSTRGQIAKPGSSPNTGSLTVTGSFIITSQNNTSTSFANGTTINKVGRTTGWTSGQVNGSCVTVNVSGTNITQLCQTLVTSGSAIIGGGDSGSGVFTGTSNITLVGIAWGGSGDGKMLVFSPLKNIRDELGPINAVQ